MSWTKSLVEWRDGEAACLSVAFTWHLPLAFQRAAWFRAQGCRVRAGGPAVQLMPEYLAAVAEVGGESPDAVFRHNPLATFTSRGCIRRCAFCAVWRTEGEFRELADWPVRPVVCDNNLLAASRAHVDRVIDRLKPLRGVEFHQGLDTRLLTAYHAGRLAELDCTIRLAFDSVGYERDFLRALELLRRAGLPKKRIRVYVLIGYQDTPTDALYRLELVRQLGLTPNPMRYSPLNSLARNAYVAPGWTSAELIRYTRYWSRLRYFGGIPFAEFTG